MDAQELITLTHSVNVILDKLSEEDRQIMEKYICRLKEITQELHSENLILEQERDEFEDKVDELENELDNIQEDTRSLDNLTDFYSNVKEIIDEHFYKNYKTYDTYEKLIDRLDYLTFYCKV